MKIAILGYGVEGKSAYNYLRQKNVEDEIEVFDQKNIEVDGIKTVRVESFLDVDYAGYGLILRSPSVAPKEILEKIIKDKNGKQDFEFSSVTQIFFDKCPAKIIGVTGTKGKGTTCSFIAGMTREILALSKENENRKVWLVGNIGVPATDILAEVKKDDIVIYEMSSFQLWDLRKSPEIAVVVHIEPDHQDVHKDMDEYLGAKANIVKWQDENGVVIYDKNNEFSSAIAEKSKGEKIDYPEGRYGDLLDNLSIVGEHNRQNGEAAILATLAGLGLEGEEADFSEELRNAIARGLKGFLGLPHRLKFVREVAGVKYYDDSISTTPGSTIAGIKSFDQPKILILGGSNKGAEFDELAKIIKASNVVKTILIGVSARKIEMALENAGCEGIINLGIDTDMNRVVELASGIAEKGDVVVLSPACASFDMFLSYSDRGEKFIEAVQKL
mgnify:CR=1 FL=1